MVFITERNGEKKESPFIEIIKGDTKFRITEEFGELVITKIDFDDNVIIVKPNVRNQISIN